MADSTKTPLKKEKVPLKSSEGETFEIDIEAFLQCKTLRIMCDGRIPLTSNILSKVVEYCNKHASGNLGWPKSAAHGGGSGGDEVEEEEEEEELKRWDNEEFLKDVDHDTLYDLFMAANELDIKSLAKLISPRLGAGKSSQEMMMMFIDEESKRMEKAEQVKIEQEKVISNILKSFNEFCSHLALIIILILGNLFYYG